MRPEPQALSEAQVACSHLPELAPLQLKVSFGQSSPVAHGSLQLPTVPAVSPSHVAVKPQSVSVKHESAHTPAVQVSVRVHRFIGSARA